VFDPDEERDIEQALVATNLPRAEHKARLKAELTARFDEQNAEKGRPKVKKHNVKRVLFGVGIAAALGIAACAAPVDVDMAVGRSVSITYTAGAGAPEPQAVAKAVEGLGHFDNVNVRVRRINDEVTVQMKLWGEEAGEKALATDLQKALPALASAQIDEEPLSGKVSSTLGKRIGHGLFDMDLASEKDVEVVRQKILADLAARGVEGQVKVEVEDAGDGKRKVKIEVKNQGEREPGIEIEEKMGP
jgi:hypothetical protein